MHELSNLEETLDYLELLRERFANLAAILTHFYESESDGFPDNVDSEAFHQLLSLRMGIAAIKAKLEWCEDSIRIVSARLEKE